MKRLKKNINNYRNLTRMHTPNINNSLKRLAVAGATAQRAMRNFNRAAELMNVGLPTVTDWRKFTIITYR